MATVQKFAVLVAVLYYKPTGDSKICERTHRLNAALNSGMRRLRFMIA
jgi:hypothetical protein